MTTIEYHESNANLNIQLTESAKTHFLSYLEKNPGHLGVRLSVKKNGCSGLSYELDYVKTPNEDDLNMPLSFQYVLYVDKASYPFLKNVQVDYIRQGLNYKMVFNNPNQKGQCGCGKSFTVD